MKRSANMLSGRTMGGLLSGGILLAATSGLAQAAPEEDVEISVESTPAPLPAAPTAPPAVSAAEVESLRQQLAALDARLANSEAESNETAQALAEERTKSAERQKVEEQKLSVLSRLAKLGVSISGYVQVQYGQNQLSADQLQQGGVALNQDRFSVRRGRLRVNGRWKYVHTDFEVDASTTRGPSTSVRRASVSGVLPSNVDGELPYLKLTFGLTEIPIGLELQQGQDDILFLERTTGSLAFFSGPVDTGAKLEGAYGPLRVQLAVMNGAPVDDRAGGPSAVDAVRAPDYLGRVGVDVTPVTPLRIAAGVSLLTGRGFHAGADATKPVLQWIDGDADGRIGSGELVSVAGRGAEPSATFERWAVGADLAVELTTRIGLTRVYGEVLLAENLDRALFVADPEAAGVDLRELSWYVALVQDVTRWGFLGVRYDEYDPNSDLFEARRGQAVPKDATIRTISPIVGVRYPGFGRLTFEYDAVQDKLARDRRGVPTDVKNDQWTFRVQGEF